MRAADSAPHSCPSPVVLDGVGRACALRPSPGTFPCFAFNSATLRRTSSRTSAAMALPSMMAASARAERGSRRRDDVPLTAAARRAFRGAAAEVAHLATVRATATAFTLMSSLCLRVCVLFAVVSVRRRQSGLHLRPRHVVSKQKVQKRSARYFDIFSSVGRLELWTGRLEFGALDLSGGPFASVNLRSTFLYGVRSDKPGEKISLVAYK